MEAYSDSFSTHWFDVVCLELCVFICIARCMHVYKFTVFFFLHFSVFVIVALVVCFVEIAKRLQTQQGNRKREL